MENGESSEECCKTMEEELYWKHFHAMHFYQVLPNDFLHHLVLPSKFSENMLGKIPKKVSLIGPSGLSWEVEVSTADNIAIVGEGWKDFAKTFNLEENYLLVFKYTKNLSFEVLIFDQSNSCEKEYCYFVQKGLPNPNNNVDREGSVDEAAKTEILEDDIDGNASDCVMSKKPKECSATDQGKQKVVEAPRATPSSDHDDVDPDFVQKGLPNPNDNVDRKRSADETASTEIMEDNIDGNASDCVMLKKPKKCSATDQGKKKVVEAPRATPSSDHDDVDPDCIILEKVRNDAVVAVSSRGRPLHQVYGSLVPKKAKVPDCASTKKLKNCSVYQRKKKIVKCPITMLAEFDSSGKTRADAIEVVGRSNEADDIADDTPINMVVAGLRTTKSKGQSAKKSSDNTAASWMHSRHKAIQQTPTGIGENEMCKEIVVSTGNNNDDLSNALCVEPLNICRSPGTIRSQKVGAKRGRPVRAIPISGKKLASKRYKQRVSKEYMSCRRPVTDEEKRATVKRATKALSEGSFLVVMRPTGVYRRFFLSIPADWINKNLSSDHFKVILRVGEKTWAGMFHNNKVRGHSAGLASGWKNFAIENNLEDSDVCVFTPASRKGDDVLILDVKIFRVVPEVTPLAPMLTCPTV